MHRIATLHRLAMSSVAELYGTNGAEGKVISGCRTRSATRLPASASKVSARRPLKGLRMSNIAQQIPHNDCGHDTVHPALSPETLGLFGISGARSRQRVSRAQPHPFVLRPFDLGLNKIAALSWGRGRVARAGIGHEAFPYSLQRASASRRRPCAPQHQCGADANRTLGQPARRARPIAGAIP
jgi:hypothetical protein